MKMKKKKKKKITYRQIMKYKKHQHMLHQVFSVHGGLPACIVGIGQKAWKRNGFVG